MPDRLTLAQAVDVVTAYAVAGDETYQRADGRRSAGSVRSNG